jgi:DNA helicase-2/ATP-dependent DNA helicase PcrA
VFDTATEIVKERIVAKHQGDEKQLEVIFSNASRVLVEAPAGYGKTNTMVSKIAYMIATKQIPAPKRLLALTFSVNAAYKIKKDISIQVPVLLLNTGLDVNTGDKIFVSNYHGFCRNVLKKYGRAFHSSLLAIDKLQSIDDSDVKRNQETVKGLSYEDAYFLTEYCSALKNSNEKYLIDNLQKYCDISIKELLPKGYISYNAIIALTLKLFKDNPNILKFYNQYFTTLLVDEYQDTNILSYWLVTLLIDANTKIILLGDSLQRIYGFIGAVEGLLTTSEKKFSLKRIKLSKNYRFASNPQMLQLDTNIRLNAEDTNKPKINNDAMINFSLYETQKDEAEAVVKKAVELTNDSIGAKVAILVKQRGNNVNSITETFEHNEVPYFYGLFTDEDVSYIQFHRKALFEFIDLIKIKDQISKKLCADHIKRLKEIFQEKDDALHQALFRLLEIFWSKVFSDFSSFSNEEKIVLVKDTFENNGLKQYIEFIDNRIIVSTVHAAKGLEWDFVILPDMEQDSFPNWVGGLCNRGGCRYKSDCIIKIDSKNEPAFLEELSVFYVAVTRARKEVFFTSSKKEAKGYSKNVSCFLKLPGIKI